MGMFDEQLARKPNNYPWTEDFIKAIHNGHWTVDEFNFKSDYAQFIRMSKEEQQVIQRTLSAVGQIEIAVKNFWKNLGDNLPHPSLNDLGIAMANNEVVHNNAYEELLDVLGMEDVFIENLKDPVISGRVNYLRKYSKRVYKDDRKQYIYSIILFTLFVENVSLFSQFFIIMAFNRFNNVLKDTSQQVEYTRNEENLHANVGMTIIRTLRQEYPELFDEELINRIKEETLEAIEYEKVVIQWILGGYKSEFLSREILNYYIEERVIDSINALDLGLDLKFEKDKELDEKVLWMKEETIGGTATDFFHKRPVDYARGKHNFDELF